MKFSLVFAFFIISCEKPIIKKYSNDKMIISIKVENTPYKKDSGIFYYGKVSIQNILDDTLIYSNKDLFILVDDNIKSRTHSDSYASNFIDFGYIKINPNDSLSIDTYWVFDNQISFKSIEISYQY